ncbi:MAG: hypothetical protein SPL94_01535 [Oribacterium sp.]|nr:hypothetical protein [Oribacterium sp.]
MRKTGEILYDRIKFSVIICLVYLLGKDVPVPLVGTGLPPKQNDILSFLSGALGAGGQRASLFSLGLQPYIAASIFVQLYISLFKKQDKDYSQAGVFRASVFLTVIFALPMAILHARTLTVLPMPTPAAALFNHLNPAVGETLTLLYDAIPYIVATVSLFTGTLFTMHLAGRNETYGIGGQSLLIFVNMLDNLKDRILLTGRTLIEQATGKNPNAQQPDESIGGMAARIPTGTIVTFILWMLVLLFIITAVSLLMENAEVHIPIHHILVTEVRRDRDYLSIRLNPSGSMPVMYVMSVFSFPYYFLAFLNLFVPVGPAIEAASRLLMLDRPLSVFLYLVLLVALTYALAGLSVNADDIAESLQKQNDYILGTHPGDATADRIRKSVHATAFLSAFVTVLLLGIPMIARLVLHDASSLYMLPMSIMILSGIYVQLHREVQAVKLTEGYKEFL